MSLVRVFVEDWQYECCGEPFAVGEVVTWNVAPVPEGDETLRAARVEAVEDHHDMAEEPTREVRGRVEGIAVLVREFAQRPDGVWAPIPGRFRLNALDRSPAAGFVYEAADGERWKQVGMVVDLAPTD